MSIEENRNCGCNDNMNDSMTSNMMNAEGRTIDCCEKEEMLQQIRCCDFAITELALYLDTHPQDDKALCLHRKYCKQAKDLKDKYQKVYTHVINGDGLKNHGLGKEECANVDL